MSIPIIDTTITSSTKVNPFSHFRAEEDLILVKIFAKKTTTEYTQL
jgi:hypothetical protein